MMSYEFEGAGVEGKLRIELEQVQESLSIWDRTTRNAKAEMMARRMRTERQLRQRLRRVQDRVRMRA